MINKNLLKLAQEDGHSVQTMLRTYAAWIKGATEEDIQRIQQAMAQAPAPWSPPAAPANATTLPLGTEITPQRRIRRAGGA